MWIANALAVFPFKHTRVWPQTTSQEATPPAGQESYENDILDTGQQAYQATSHVVLHINSPERFQVHGFYKSWLSLLGAI